MIKDPIMFLGAYVSNASLSAGWNGESSSCSLTLVEENDNPDKKGEKVGNVKFQPPDIGTACMFSILDDGNQFKFCGILKRYSYVETVNDGRKWDVSLESPHVFLDGIQIILNHFKGTIYTSDNDLDQLALKPTFKYATDVKTDYSKKSGASPSNVINLFAYKENKSQIASAKFGGADINSLGYPVANIIQDIHACCKDKTFGGKLYFAGTEYELDLSEFQPIIEKLAPADFRVSTGLSISLTELLNKMAEAASYDYFAYIDVDEKENPSIVNGVPPSAIGSRFNNGNVGAVSSTPNTTSNLTADEKLGILKKAKIKVRAIDRSAPPDPDYIKNYIKDFTLLPDSENNLIGYRIGKELNDGTITQRVIVGDMATRNWVASKDYMLPIWGEMGSGPSKTYFYGSSMDDYFNLFNKVTVAYDALQLANDNEQPAPVKQGTFLWFDTNMLEIRCALSGKETWLMYHKLFTLAYREAAKTGSLESWLQVYNYHSPLDVNGPMTSFLTIKDLQDIFSGNATTHSMLDTTLDNAQIYASYAYGTRDAQKDYLQRIMNTRFNVIQKSATDYYGKQALIAIPSEPGGKENNFRWVGQDSEYELVWKLASSAWAGDEITQKFPDPAFYDGGQGRFVSCASYPVFEYDPVWGGILVDYSKLSDGYTQYSYKTDDGKEKKQIMTKSGGTDLGWGINFFDTKDLQYPPVTNKRLLKGEPVKDSTGKTVSTNHMYGFCKVSFPPVSIYDSITTQTNAFGVLAKLIFRDDSIIGKATKAGYQNMFGSESHDKAGIAPAYLPPDFINVPQQSTRHVWGPWWALKGWDTGDKASVSGARAGKVNIEQDTEIKPESYGSIKKMNESAQTICEAGLIGIHATETGYIQLAESPKYNLLDRLRNKYGPYISTIEISISDSEITTTYNFTTWAKKINGLALYNIERIRKAQGKKFELDKRIRELAIQPRLPSVNTGLMKSLEETFVSKLNTNSNQGIFAATQKALWRSLNTPLEGTPEYDQFPQVSAHSSSTEGAMKAIGTSPEESFGSSFEQIFSPAYIWDQRHPEAHKILFNQGLFETRGKGTEYSSSEGPYKGNDIPPLIEAPKI